MLRVWIALVALLAVFIEPIFACNGYTLKVNHAKTCSDNSVIKLEDGNASFDQDCNVIISGCVVVTKPFKTAKGTYNLQKAPMPPLSGDIDFCDMVSNLQDVQLVAGLKTFGVDKSCPFAAAKFCGAPNKKINISKYKNQLGLVAGSPAQMKFEIDHDVGKSCLDVNIVITKAKRHG